jgi:hypothetical protein
MITKKRERLISVENKYRKGGELYRITVYNTCTISNGICRNLSLLRSIVRFEEIKKIALKLLRRLM